MLRECRRTLKQGGRIGCLTTETADGLSDAALIRAAELGPTQVAASGSLERMVRRSGFEIEHVEDLTSDLVATCRAMVEAFHASGDELRAAMGREFDEQCGKRTSMVEGVEAGLIRRTLVVARAT